LKKPNISILSDEFLAEVQHLPQRNLAVKLLQKNGFSPTTFIQLRHLLPLPRAKEYKNPVEEISRPARSFAEMLEATIRRYQTAPSKLRKNLDTSWDSSASGWTLQTNANLATPTWGNYLGTIVNNSVTNSPPKGNLFFRLKNP
jgi:hypothetical protein